VQADLDLLRAGKSKYKDAQEAVAAMVVANAQGEHERREGGR
jgi:hypothetical protein